MTSRPTSEAIEAIDPELAAIVALLRTMRRPTNRAARRINAKTGRKRALLYLRVSSKGQLTDYDDDGLSIPAQRDIGHRKAEDLDADVVGVFIESAQTGTKVENRDEFLAMLSYLKRDGNIDYVIVPKVDRFARDRGDDAIMSRWVSRWGAELVSCTEGIDGTPSGQLVHGMLAAVAEFYSANLRTEVIKGQRQKAKVGGTPGRAPLGYLNVRAQVNGREIRTVAIDQDRALLIYWAFEQYATGNWSVARLAAKLAAKGLTTRPTPHFPEQPITAKHLYKILHNPYYYGAVVFEGVVYEGRHEPIVSKQLFLDVQTQLLAHDQSKGKRAKNDHYLKGSLFCARCESRVGISYSRGRHGERYLMSYCLRRHRYRNCPLPYVMIERVEAAVERHYRNIQITPERHAALRDGLHHHLTAERERLVRERERNQHRVAALKAQRVKLLQLHYKEEIAKDLFLDEQRRLDAEIAEAEEGLAVAILDNERLVEIVDIAVDLAANCYNLYRSATPAERRLLNQTFFERILLDIDGEILPDSPLAEPFASILSNESKPTRPRARAAAGTARRTQTKNPEPSYAVRGSSTGLLVELRGIEPLTSSMRTKRATNCATAPSGVKDSRPDRPYRLSR
jgi:site-specific DNA recombinase